MHTCLVKIWKKAFVGRRAKRSRERVGRSLLHGRQEACETYQSEPSTAPSEGVQALSQVVVEIAMLTMRTLASPRPVTMDA